MLTAFRLLSEREGQWHDGGPQCKTTGVCLASADHTSVNVVACCMNWLLCDGGYGLAQCDRENAMKHAHHIHSPYVDVVGKPKYLPVVT